MTKIRFAALDGSLRNFGIAKMEYDTAAPADQALSVISLRLVETEKSKNKQVRASSDNLTRAQTIAKVIREEMADCAMVFAEVPSGGQDYNAVLGFGIVIGLYAGIVPPVVEVSPSETKMAAVGTRTASKEEMIEWAVGKFPAAPWLMTKRGGVMVPVKKNEHLADAVAIAYAGIRTPTFQQTLSMLTAMKVAA